jgi:hypothetical protein
MPIPFLPSQKDFKHRGLTQTVPDAKMVAMQRRFLRPFVLAAASTVIICLPLARSSFALQFANDDAREVASENFWWIGETLPFDDLKYRPSESWRQRTGNVVPDFFSDKLFQKLAISTRCLTKVLKIHELHRVYLI